MRKIFKVSVFCIVLFCIYLIYNYLTYDFYYKDGEKDGNAVISPNETYSAQVYYKNYGGAVGGVNLFVNVINLNDNLERTIYFSDAKGNIKLNWIDDNILFVENFNEYENRNIKLFVGKEIYDESGKACNSYKIKKEYACYDESFSKSNS